MANKGVPEGAALTSTALGWLDISDQRLSTIRQHGFGRLPAGGRLHARADIDRAASPARPADLRDGSTLA